MHKPNPVISVITPVYNRAEIIRKTADSVCAQTFQNWELLIVDDGSSDNIDEVIRSHYEHDQRIRFLKRDRLPKGASTCRNIGAEKAEGEYLLFLDSDDLLEPFCLEQRIELMLKYPELDLAVFPFRVLQPDGSLVPNNFDNGRDPLINFLSNSSYWAIMCVLWKKSFFHSIGGFNPEFPRYQDPEIHIRALTCVGMQYRMFMQSAADTIVIPSEKKESVAFALDIHRALTLLLPQTHAALTAAGKTEYMRFMNGYLKEFLGFLAYANFNTLILQKASGTLAMFHAYGALSERHARRHRAVMRIMAFAVKGLRKMYLVFLGAKR